MTTIHYRSEQGVAGYKAGDILVNDDTGERSAVVTTGAGLQLEPAKDRKTRTITLTGRAPVRIVEEDWQVIADGKRWNGEFESQADRSASLKVREHVADGRVIVSGVYSTRWQGERDIKAGVLLDEGRQPTTATSGNDAAVVAAIRQVVADLGYSEGLADDVIADLPAEAI